MVPPSVAGSPPAAKDGKYFDTLIDPGAVPPWLTEKDLDFYSAEFSRTGFGGGLNWYRNLDRTWELMAAYRGAQVTVPALFIAGEEDRVIAMLRPAFENLSRNVPNLTKRVLLPGCGHWIQQERPADVNAALIDFLKV